MTDFARSPDLIPSCNSTGCLQIPSKAPILYVPAKVGIEGLHPLQPVTLRFPHMHYCDDHWESDMKLDLLLTDAVKARVEERGRKIWPHGIVPDFDAALINPWDVFSPEYVAYMRKLGFEVDGMGFSAQNFVRGLMRHG